MSGRSSFWILTRLRSVTVTALASIGLVLSTLDAAQADAAQRVEPAASSGPSERMDELPARPSPRSVLALRTHFRSARHLNAETFDDELPGAICCASKGSFVADWSADPAPSAVDVDRIARIARLWASAASRAPPTG